MKARSADGLLSARLALRVLAFCEARGHDRDRLARDVGLSLATLSEPEGRISRGEMARLGDRALDLTRDETFGLHLASDVADPGKLDNGVLLLMACPTVRAAIDKLIVYQRYWGDGDRAKLFPVPGGLGLRYALPEAEGSYARHADECAMAELVIGIRFLSGDARPPRVVRFRHRQPACTDAHRALFACPLVFGAPATEIELDDALLDAATRHANELFCAVFEQQIQQAIARLPAATRPSDTVRRTLRGALAGGRCGLAETAKALGTSPRTLQRQLSEEGTSFAKVVAALRREMAQIYLDRGLPLGEIAELLGYADVTAFHHAYRRWTGTSPGKIRLGPSLARGGAGCASAPKSWERAPRRNEGRPAWSFGRMSTAPRLRSDGLVVFSLLACALTWGLATPLILAWVRKVEPPSQALSCAGLAAFGPLIAAAIVSRAQGRFRETFGRWRTPLPWVLLALLTPLLVHLVALGIATLVGIAPDRYLHPPQKPEQLAALLVFPFGEELGWRGFAYPRFVARLGVLRGALAVGLLWAVWHLAYAVTPEAGRFDGITLLMLLSLLPLYSVLLAWMAERSGGGLALAVAFHAGGHLDNLQVASRADLRLHVAHVCVVLPLALLAGRALSRPRAAQP